MSTPNLFECASLSIRLLDNLNVHKDFYGKRWPELMADLGTALQLQMKAAGNTNAIDAALPIAKKMAKDGENPLLFLAVATELACAELRKTL